MSKSAYVTVSLSLSLLSLYIQSIRICIQQGSLIMANYMSEQLEQDLKRNELVRSGELTKEEADEQAEQWEKV